jgi:hypothetical protein
MKTRVNRIVLICSTVALAMLLWAGVATAKPAPHKWMQHHRAVVKAEQPSLGQDQSDECAAVVRRRIGKAFVAVSRPAPAAASTAVTAGTVPPLETSAHLTVRRRIGKAFVAVSRPAPVAGTAIVTPVPLPETHAQLAVRRPAGKGYVGTTASVAQAR